MRKFGQEIIEATAGKKIHGTGAIPGGVNKNLSVEERDELLKQMETILEWARGALQIAKDYTLGHLDDLKDFGSFPSNHLSLVREDGAMDLYDGNLRAIDAEGDRIFDQVTPLMYKDYIAEEVTGLVLPQVPLHSRSRTGKRLVPGRSSVTLEHLRFHRHAGG